MFAAIKAILIDLSGTIHIESNAIPGAIGAINRLRSSNLSYRFVTNTTKESQNYLYNRLTNIGFQISSTDEIFTSLLAAKQLIKKLNLKPYLMLEEEAMEDFADVSSVADEYSNGNAVVVGLAPNKFHYESMNTAFHMLMNGSRLIAINKSRYYKKTDGLSLGCGPFVSALEFATDTTATVVGKPANGFFMSALELLGCEPHEAIMIGDDVRDDIDGAQRCGVTGILVQTGKYRCGDERKINPGPNFVFPSFGDAINYVLDNR